MNLGNSISKMFKRIFTKPVKKEVVKVDMRINADKDKRMTHGGGKVNTEPSRRKHPYKNLEGMHFGTFSPVRKF